MKSPYYEECTTCEKWKNRYSKTFGCECVGALNHDECKPVTEAEVRTELEKLNSEELVDLILKERNNEQ